jgi:alkanesulfonate monooxygenase SsuD/methylene tetrahydromethanopterin reductase-like flavin-dependent oxidoreductase (luciferase family)
MKYGFILPYGDARTAADLAYEAEQAGWDGFFVLDPVWGIDAWVSLAAAAMRTERICLGPVLTPLSRIKPWKLASETTTLDNLSNGRVILPVGLGDIDEFEPFGEVTDRKTRAELLDEGLDILTGLWRGQPFSYNGQHYKIKETQFFPPPPPVQQPRIPIWVVGAWPSKKSMQRVLRYDGLLPQVLKPTGGTSRSAQRADIDDVRAMRAYITAHRTDPTPFDIVIEGETPGDDRQEAARVVTPWAEAGATWWLEALWDADTQDQVRQRIQQGPLDIA